MKKHPIATIINFCSNESRFIRFTIEEAQKFSSEVVVVVCDHFFNGVKEDLSLLESLYQAFPQVQFIEYPFIPNKIPKNIWKKIDPAHFWHSLSRLIGFSHIQEEVESVLFIDADEVPDAHLFSNWLEQSDYQLHTALKLANYWYFREPSNQAIQFEDSIVLAQKKAIEPDIVLHEEERDAIYNLLPNPKRRKVTSSCGRPMFHHYSWVRTEEEMLQKVKAWGHRSDRDWTALVQKEFSTPFSGTDFVHGYEYRTVTPPFPILLEPPLFVAKGEAKLKRMRSEEVLNYLPKRKFWQFFSE